MEGIVGLIILVISAIGWISNAINEQKAKNNRRPVQQAPNKQRKIHEEIEKFLQEVNQASKPQVQQPEPPVQVMKRDEPAPRPRPVQPRADERRSRREEKKRAQKSSRRNAKAEKARTLDEAVREQKQKLKKQIQQQPLTVQLTDEFLNTLNREQIAALQRMTMQPSAAVQTPPAAPKLKLDQLLAADHIRQSFIINEILQPPLALRNRD